VKILEKYSLDCGISPKTLSRPNLYLSYIPLKQERFITVSTDKDHFGKSYPYFQEVVDQIIEDLEENNIGIVQVGSPKGERLEGCDHFVDNLTPHQIAYIQESSLLYFGNANLPFSIYSTVQDSSSASIIPFPFGAKDLFSEVLWATTIKVNGEDDESGWPNPEKVAEKILESLSISPKSKFETVYIGSKFPKKVIDVVPDRAVAQNFMPGVPVSIRFDYLSEVNVSHIECAILSSASRETIIVVDKPIETALFTQHRGKTKIVGCVFHIKNPNIGDSELEFFRKMAQAGIKVNPALVYEDFSPRQIGEIKLKLIDNGLVSEVEQTRFDLIPKDKISENTFVKSSRFIFSESKLFLSKQSFLEGQSSSSNVFQLSNLKGLTNWGKELEYSYIFNKVLNK
jgi:hypothetical protein